MVAKLQRIFEYGRAALAVVTDDGSALEWLTEFLSPQFLVRAAGPWTRRVVLSLDRDEFAALRIRGCATGERIDCFTLDGRFQQHVVWYRDAAETVVRDSPYGAFYRIARGTAGDVRIVANPARSQSRLALMRVVRELATGAALLEGQLPLHGAALAVDGQGMVITGPKRAGKTTFLIHSLRSQGAHYISNDRMMIRSDASGGFVVRGMPTIVKVRAGTLEHLSWFGQRYRQTPYYRDFSLAESRQRLFTEPAQPRPNPSLTATQFCRLLNVEPLAEAALSRIVFPEVDESLETVQLQRLSADVAAELLAANVLRADRPQRLPAAFFEGQQPPPESHLEELSRQLAAQVPAYRCRLGRHVYQERRAVAGLWKRAAA